jgi:hypothetical protein
MQRWRVLLSLTRATFLHSVCADAVLACARRPVAAPAQSAETGDEQAVGVAQHMPVRQ